MEVRKTEYYGIVFDSKSEAVFARCLHLAGHSFFYHPAEHCGHAWDFLVFRKPNRCYQVKRVGGIGGTIYRNDVIVDDIRAPILIEYKPSVPTKTYVSNLTEMMRADPIESILVFGNPWDKNEYLANTFSSGCCYISYPIFTKHGKYGWGDFNVAGDSGEDVPVSYRHNIKDLLGITPEMPIDARKYRFDLAHPLRTQNHE